MKQLGVIIFVVALLVVIGGLIYWAVSTTAPDSVEAEITSFTVDRPDMVIETRGDVAAVSVFGVPEMSATGTATTSEEDLLLGEAAQSGENGDTEEAEDTTQWRVEIPIDPLAITAVYAEAYDENGEVLDQESLEQTGPSAVHEALWGVDAGTGITLGVGESGTVGDVELTINEITEDTRCSSEESCPDAVVTADATVQIADDESEDVELSTESQTSVGEYILQILEVSPEIDEGMEGAGEIGNDQYRLRILVFREAKL